MKVSNFLGFHSNMSYSNIYFIITSTYFYVYYWLTNAGIILLLGLALNQRYIGKKYSYDDLEIEMIT